MFTTIPIFKDCVSVLMEATPKDIDVASCFMELRNVEGVEEIHDFHVWALSVGKMAMSAHVRAIDSSRALS